MCLVKHPGLVDQYLGLAERVEQFCGQRFITEFTGKRFAVTVLLGVARCVVNRFGAQAPSQFRSVFAAISGPLSNRICS